VHTLQWTATDNAGNTDGIGSRYFTIQNTGNDSRVISRGRGGLPPCFPPASSPDEPIYLEKGYNQNVRPQRIYPDENGIINIRVKELDRMEIYLFEGTRGLAPLPDAPLANFQRPSTNDCWGFQLVGDQVRPLPIGSFLDIERGIFYWQPGPGFLGVYNLVFLESGPNGVMTKKNIFVEIVPQTASNQ